MNHNVISLYKTLKYSQLFPIIPVEEKELDFFVSYSMYEVSIDVISEYRACSNLDFFEEAVLGLLSHEPMIAEEIADTLCIEVGLAKEVLARLYANSFLKENYIDLSDKGKLYVNQVCEETNKFPVETLKRYIFKLNDKGKNNVYLPLFLTEAEVNEYRVYTEFELETELICSETDDTIQVNFGTKGNRLIVQGKKYGKPKDKPVQIDISDIYKIIEVHNDLHPEKSPIAIRNIHDVDCEYKGVYWVHCKGTLLKKRNQIMVSEGQSEQLFPLDSYIPGNGSLEIIKTIKMYSTIKEGNTSEKKDVNVSYKNPQYKELEELIKSIKISTEKLKEEVESLQGGQYRVEVYHSYITEVYSAFEWLFFYYLKGKKISTEVKKDFESIEFTLLNRVNLIAQGAKKLGLRWRGDYKELFYKSAGLSFKEMSEKTEPNLWNSLTQLILTSLRKPEKGIHQLCQEYPSLLSIFRELKNKRDKIAHSVEQVEDNQGFNEHIMCFLMDAMQYLLPEFRDVEIKDNFLEVKHPEERVYNDYFLEELALIDILPLHYVKYVMTDALKDSWMVLNSKRKRLGVVDFLHRLYQNMQSTLVLALYRGKSCSPITKEELLDQLYQEVGRIEAFNTVVATNIDKAFNKKRSTLGALGIVFLYFLKCHYPEVMKKVVEQGFVSALEIVISERKHGNRMILNITEDVLEEAYKKWLLVVQTIGEEL